MLLQLLMLIVRPPQAGWHHYFGVGAICGPTWTTSVLQFLQSMRRDSCGKTVFWSNGIFILRFWDAYLLFSGWFNKVWYNYLPSADSYFTTIQHIPCISGQTEHWCQTGSTFELISWRFTSVDQKPYGGGRMCEICSLFNWTQAKWISSFMVMVTAYWKLIQQPEKTVDIRI